MLCKDLTLRPGRLGPGAWDRASLALVAPDVGPTNCEIREKQLVDDEDEEYILVKE